MDYLLSVFTFLPIIIGIVLETPLASYINADARWGDAYRLFGRAGQLFATAGDTQGQAMCANGQGEAARHHGNAEDALRCYALFLDAMTHVGHVHGQGLAQTNMGWTCLGANRFEEAHGHFVTSIALHANGLFLVSGGVDQIVKLWACK